MKNWIPTNTTDSKYIGTLEIENVGYFEVLEMNDRLVFGGACNAGFLESGYILREEYESLDETLQELNSDLECFYRDGKDFVSRIVCNERM